MICKSVQSMATISCWNDIFFY